MTPPSSSSSSSSFSTSSSEDDNSLTDLALEIGLIEFRVALVALSEYSITSSDFDFSIFSFLTDLGAALDAVELAAALVGFESGLVEAGGEVDFLGIGAAGAGVDRTEAMGARTDPNSGSIVSKIAF